MRSIVFVAKGEGPDMAVVRSNLQRNGVFVGICTGGSVEMPFSGPCVRVDDDLIKVILGASG
jgi:hypothetical protein